MELDAVTFKMIRGFQKEEATNSVVYERMAEKTDNNPHAFRASVYIGVASLVTVVILIIPSLVYPEEKYVEALITLLVFAIVVILHFNYYVSVAQNQPFWSRFGRMAAISLGVALISFRIGQVAKTVLGVEF